MRGCQQDIDVAYDKHEEDTKRVVIPEFLARHSIRECTGEDEQLQEHYQTPVGNPVSEAIVIRLEPA